MADQSEDKTIDPTPQRIMKAFEEGQIGFSSELSAALVFLMGMLFFWIAGPMLLQMLRQIVQVRMLVFQDVIRSEESIAMICLQCMYPVLLWVLALLGVITVIPAIAGALQTRFNITTKPLSLKPERLNPVEGFKRLFSSRSVTRFLTSMARAAVVAVAAYWVLNSRLDEISTSGLGSLENAFGIACQAILVLSLATGAMMAIVGVGDLAFQKWKNFNEMRMTVKEVRDEQKDSDGDPMVKARMRKMAAERMKSSLAREVPRATVIITNPTHFAIAIRYDKSEGVAPIVIAKGADNLARRIIELANEHDIPIVERKPVARFLYYKARIGQMIPMEMYMAVAEILNFVNKRRTA